MKDHFVKLLSVGMLVVGSSVWAQTGNLRLELIGPFAICEQRDGKLEIRIPDLHDTHNVPGFRSETSEYPLDYKGPYNLAMSDLTHSGNMSLSAGFAKHKIALYAERLPNGTYCQPNTGAGQGRVSFVVPPPDEVVPEAPADEKERIQDDKGKPHGQWGSAGGKYATHVILKYTSVDLKKLTIYGGAKPWNPDSGDLGPDVRITLEVVPLPETHPLISHLQSAIAFKQVAEMVISQQKPEDARHLCFGQDPCPLAVLENQLAVKTESEIEQLKAELKKENQKKGTPDLAAMSSSAKDCHAPLLFLCHSGGTCP